MGNKQNKSKSEIKFSPLEINKAKFFECIQKKKLNSSPDFSIENMKNKAILLYDEAINCINEKEKYLKLEDAISYDNTNDKILKEYLTIAQKYRNDYNTLIEKYYYHISPNSFQDITGHNKKKCSKELLLETLIILKDYNLNDKTYNDTIIEKRKIVDYFFSNIKVKPSLIANSYFSKNSNLELALYEMYCSLLKQIYDHINAIKSLVKGSNLDFQEKLERICRPVYWKEIKVLINEVKVDEYIAILYNSIFFTDILITIKNYICNLEDTIKKCLELKNIETDFYILLFIILEIKYIIYNKSEPVYTNKLKNYIQIENNEDPMYLNLVNDYGLKIEKSYKYDIDEIIKEIKNGASINHFNEIRLYKYIKLEYYTSNNIIRYMMKFVNKFNEKISKSKTIIEALYKIYPELKQFNLFESEFTSRLFQNALKNCYFFPFKGKIGSTTLNNSGTILFFIPNKTKIKENDLKLSYQIKFYLIGNLAVFLYIELHEVLVHFLRITLSKITEYEYISPRSPDSDRKEAGQCIEFLLFGKRVSSFSINELLFLLDVVNYNKSLEKFNEEFNNINSKRLNPSKELKEMLKEINLDFNFESINDPNNAADLFIDSYILEDFNIEVPLLQNCVENYEFDEDYDLI